MFFIDKILSWDEKISRKKYILFFVIFSFLLVFVLLTEVALGGIIYLTVADKLLGNFHFLFFPIVLLFLFLLGILSGFFIVYVALSLKRAADFSENPVQYVVYYTLLISLICGIALIGKVAAAWKILLTAYFLLFAPYLFFKKEQKK